MKIVLPKTFCEIDPFKGPLFFFVGPVRGGDDWQAHAIEEVGKHMQQFYAVVPYHFETNHPLMEFRAIGDDDRFERQLTWERFYLNLAGIKGRINGCVVFWLPAESKTRPRGGEYARDTRGELGEWRGRLMSDPGLRVVIGGEPGFPGIDVIRRNFEEALGYEFPIYSSLNQTIAAAVAKSQEVNTADLKRFFKAHQCPGVVALIDFLETPKGEGLISLGSSTIGLGQIDKEIFLTEEARLASAWARTRSAHIGSTDGSMTPLQWIEQLSFVFEELPKLGTQRFDSFCGEIAGMVQATSKSLYTNEAGHYWVPSELDPKTMPQAELEQYRAQAE